VKGNRKKNAWSPRAPVYLEETEKTERLAATAR
jgi:hypothetical protein